MSLLSLSPELIEAIASYLRAQDLASLTLSCKRFRDVVAGSLLLQYTYRTELAGVYDPLSDLSAARSIADRMETLRRWEASWADLGRYLTRSPRLVIPAERDLYGPFFLTDDYLFAVDWQGGQEQGQGSTLPPALLYVDLRDTLRTGQHLWKQIDYPHNSIAITQAFSIQEDDLVVSVLSFPRDDDHDDAPTKTVLRFLSLETGSAHPLAREADLTLDTTLPVNLLDIRADVIGDQIVLVLVDLRVENPECDVIYLVDWKQGRMTLVHRAPHGTYEGALAVLSSDLVLFLKQNPPSIELCRVTSPSANPSHHDDDDDVSTPTPTPMPTLRAVRTLALPAFHPDYRVHTAYMQTDRHSERRPDSEAPQQQQRTEHARRLVRALAPLPFHSAPEDMVVSITFLLRLRGTHEVWKKVVTTISRRALFALAAEGTGTGRAPDDGCEGGDDSGVGDACSSNDQGEVGGEDGTVEVEKKKHEQDLEVVPWEEWGPSAARVIAPSSFQWITAHAGQRWLSFESGKLVIRDFSAARVRRARARAHRDRLSPTTTTTTTTATTTHVNNNEGNGGVGGETRMIVRGGPGTCFQDDVVSSLRFLETHVDVEARKHSRDMILTDGERLITFVRGIRDQPPTFEVHILEEDPSDNSESSPPVMKVPSPPCPPSTSVSSPKGSRTPRSRSRTRGGDTTALANGSATYQSA